MIDWTPCWGGGRAPKLHFLIIIILFIINIVIAIRIINFICMQGHTLKTEPNGISIIDQTPFFITLASSYSSDSSPTLDSTPWVGRFSTMDSNDILGWANLAFRQNCQQLKSYTLWSVPKFLLNSEFIVGIYSQWLAPPGE